MQDAGKKVCKQGEEADGKELRKEGIKGGGVRKLERVPAFFSRLNHERQMSERINYRPTPNPSPLINE